MYDELLNGIDKNIRRTDLFKYLDLSKTILANDFIKWLSDKYVWINFTFIKKYILNRTLNFI